MASSVIHMCVANEINKKLKRNNDQVLIGSIAPDIAKHLGRTKKESHFLTEPGDIPNMELFLEKYKKHMKDDFVLGYYIHLYTDYLWFKYFFKDFASSNQLYLLDGTVAVVSQEQLKEYFYNDYTTLNKVLIEDYNLDLSAFDKKILKPKNIIKEIPMNELQLIIDKTKMIINKSQEKKSYVFNDEKIHKFIETCEEAILSHLRDIGYLKN